MPITEVTSLVKAARAVRQEFHLSHDFTAGSVGAALQTRSGRIYTGVCLDVSCGLGFCAEQAAVAEMLKNRESEIIAVVAVGESGVLPPCGRCRELIAQINAKNMDAAVALSEDRLVTLRELLPEHWLNAVIL
jgi:cytidine deaminase